MTSVINPTTLQFLRSVNTPEYPAPWVVNPDMSQVVGVDRKYWKWDAVGGRPIPMTGAEQTAFDLAAIETARDSIVAQLDRQEDVLRAVMTAVINELNAASDAFNALKAAVAAANNIGSLKSGVAAIPARPTRTMAQLRNVVRNALGS